MARWQWASQFHIPTSVIASTQASGYAPSRVGILDNHPLIRTWRSTSTAQQDVILDLGSTKAGVAFALLNMNFTTVQLATSLDNVSYTFFPGSPYTITKDAADFYKLFVARTVSYRYLLVRIPAQTPIGGAAYFELGMVVCVAALNTFIGSPRLDMERTVGRPYLRSGADDVTPVGLNRITDEWQMIVPLSQRSTHEDFSLLGQHTPILVFENAGISHQVRLARYTEDIRARIGGTTYTINPSMREMV